MSFLWHDLPPTGKVFKYEDRLLPESNKWIRRATTDLNEVLPEQKGCESVDIPYSTVPQTFRELVAKFPDRISQCYQRNHETPFEHFTWAQHLQHCINFAKALIAVGVNSRDCITIKGFNHYAWTQAYLGSMFANVVPAGIYPTNGPESTWYIMDHTDARVTVVDTAVHAQAMLDLKPRLPKLGHVVVYMEDVSDELRARGKELGVAVRTWQEFLNQGAAVPIEKVEAREAEIRPTLPATLIYTSGTTGNPKGVLLTHDNLMCMARIASSNLIFKPEDRMISFLPLSHIAACMLDVLVPITSGQSTWYAQPDAMKGSLSKTLALVRPTLFLGVPRVWEKVQEALQQASRNGPALMRCITGYTKPAVKAAVEGILYRNEPMPLFARFAEATINTAVKKKLGLDQCRIFASGAAPLSQHTADFFDQLGMPISNLFGMTESSALVSLTAAVYGGIKVGAAGRIFDGFEATIMDPDAEGNGELLYRSRTLFVGYYKDQAATDAAITPEGFLRTGDIARIDEDKFLFITGRSKELIITAGGENVAPAPIEDAIKAELMRLVANVMVIGDMRKFLTCIVTLKPLSLEEPGVLAKDTVDFLVSQGITGVTTAAEAKAHAGVNKLIEAGIRAANKKAVSRASVVQKFALLDRDFTEAEGEVTATMKLKRAVVYKKNLAAIDAMYEGANQE